MRTLVIALLLWSCDSKNGDSASGTDDTSGGDDSATADDSAPGGDLDGDGVDAPDDCNDDDPSIFPGADEAIGDGVDQDCDGLDRCYVDDDGDGYGGDTTISAKACDDAGLSIIGGDCEDADVAYHPGAKESCDQPFDYNCDESVEYADDDKDGWAACEDCDDTNGEARPDGVEIAADGVDQDCDGGDACFADADGDGFGGAVTVASADFDCSDAGEATTDEDCLDSGDGAGSTWPGIAFEDSTSDCMTDADGDGYGSLLPAAGVTAGSDCNDAVADAHPGGTDVPGDGIDSDCNTTETCYFDGDGDGYGTAKIVSSIDADCADAGEGSNDEDCLDAGDDAAVTYPGAAYNESATACQTDADGDGFGAQEPSSGVTPGLDCDDADATVSCAEIHIGNDVEFADASTHYPDYLLGPAIVVPSDMTLTALALIGKAAAGNVRMALYTDSGGTPDALLVATETTAVPVGVLEIPVKPVALPAATYWLMAVYDTKASIGIMTTAGKKDLSLYRSLDFSDPMPDPFGSTSMNFDQLFNYYIVGY
jgi:hypothetical protein